MNTLTQGSMLKNDCSCDKCAYLCEKNPGWMTPEEASKAIKSGYGARLMRDWLEPCVELGNDDRIYLLAPASLGCEWMDAPEFDIFEMMMGGT